MTATGNEPILEIDGLCISYFTRAGEIPAVVDFDLTVMPGETVGLVGESGCGKSTVAMAIMRYLGKNGGIVGGGIRFKGRDLVGMSEEALRELRGGEIAMVYQEPMAALNPSLTIGAQLEEVPIVHERASRADARRRAIAMLEDVKLPDPERVMASYPHQISGGQQQRVVIAMALLGRPSLLLLDEPTTALDVTVEAGIVELIAGLSARYGTSQIFISHNLGLVRETCERICVMYSGEAVETGSIDEVFNRARHPYTRGLFEAIPLPSADKNARPLVAIPGQLPLPHERPEGCNFAPRCSHCQRGRCDVHAIAMETVAPGHGSRCVRWREIDWGAGAAATKDREPVEPGAEILEFDGMRKYYPIAAGSLSGLVGGGETRHVKANEDISFSAREREVVAIVGESGCGKSTLARVLMGLETATEGAIRFAGAEIGSEPVEKRSAEQIGSLQMVFQNPNDTLNPSMTVGRQIGRVLRRFGVAQEREEVRERVLRLLDLVKLPRAFYDRRPRQLSGGQKQRVGIARAFAGEPQLVVADEPVSALDVSVQAAVTELLMDIQRRHGTTLLFISHDLSVVRYLADRIVVMYLGRIMEQGTTEEIFAPPYCPYTEALLAAVPIADVEIDKRRIVLEGPLPSAVDPPEGCPFSTRCPRRIGEVCDKEPPPRQRTATGHEILCHIPLEELARAEPVFFPRAPEPEAAD